MAALRGGAISDRGGGVDNDEVGGVLRGPRRPPRAGGGYHRLDEASISPNTRGPGALRRFDA